LSDARTPTAHAGTHVPGGTDVLDYTKIVGYGTALPTWSATTHPAGVLWVVNTVGEPYSLYRSDGVSAWKQVGGGGASVTASDSVPSSPTSGALWFDSTTGKTFIWYVDGSSNQWVEVGEASQLSIPTHGSSHVRGGSDIIDADRLTVDYVPTYYTRNAAASGAGHVTDLTANLGGIDDKFNQLNPFFIAQSTYTPTLTAGATISKTINQSGYTKVGKFVFGTTSMSITSAGTANNTIISSLPLGPTLGAGQHCVGSWYYGTSGGTTYTGSVVWDNDNARILFRINGGTGYSAFGSAITVVSGDYLTFSYSYFTNN
jgi:hypothetical protein